ncbi:hypothetical protein NQ317_016675 [Molorchus minor]|uniref:Uncharacterized protein n=1 Tax=Molorchus minor TaxID=1323400 RepID=A0ABQ9J3Y0_9CUCU|nr:hypothetical protein NQ317_016675 [Molorchus minor]
MKILETEVVTLFIFLPDAFCQSARTFIPITRQTFSLQPDGTYNYAVETANQIFAEEQGYLRDPQTLVKQGQYQFTSPEGKVIRLVYTADENGFHPQGEHLPTPPPIPLLIQKSLEFQRLEEQQQRRFK